MYNNEMDDFSYPGITNAFGVEPSPSNYAKPGKRPQSSMCPTILFDSLTKKPVMTLGGAGGTKITTASMQNAINVLSFKMDASYAVSTPRLHHQLLPMRLEYQVGFEEDMVELLAEKEHEMYEYSYKRVR
jgi:gamma-glutamyltranspeptidase/glutathione hydrolase/leukotriene-C4 hydrolase